MNDLTTQQRMTPIQEFKRDIRELKDKGELALPSTVRFDSFQNALVMTATDNPDILLKCSKQSIFKAVRTLAAAGLVPDGREAAIAPFNGEAQAMPMVQGLIKIARNSGKIASLWADVVYEGETIEIWVEDGEKKFNHTQADGSKIDAMERGGEVRGAYAVAKLTDGTVEFRPMSKAQIEKRRMASATQKDPQKPTGNWAAWYEEMAMKTVIRNLAKRLPMASEDIERLMQEQDRMLPIRDITPEEPQRGRRNLAQAMEENEAPKPVSGEILEPEQDQKEAPQVDQNSLEYAQGATAAKNGKSLNDCPHGPGTPEWMNWAAGWKAERDAEDEPDA